MNATRAHPADRPIQIPSRMPQGHVHLGLDFGTHSTKAILCVRGDNRPLVPFLDEPAADYPVFCSPSLVRLVDGRLYFGAAALAGGGELFRSLKVSLLPHSAQSVQRPALPNGAEPEMLVALYISWLLGRIRGALGNVPDILRGLEERPC